MRGSKHHYRREEEMARGELNSVIGDYDSSRVVRVLDVDRLGSKNWNKLNQRHSRTSK